MRRGEVVEEPHPMLHAVFPVGFGELLSFLWGHGLQGSPCSLSLALCPGAGDTEGPKTFTEAPLPPPCLGLPATGWEWLQGSVW